MSLISNIFTLLFRLLLASLFSGDISEKVTSIRPPILHLIITQQKFIFYIFYAKNLQTLNIWIS